MAFLDCAQSFLYMLAHQIESIPGLDYDEAEHALTIHLPDQRVYLFNIHQGMEQLWLSSPFSGGRHFYYHNSCWLDTRTGDARLSVLKQEILTHYQISLDGSSLDNVS